jgi:CelD/BcsL family acetyltransferase involved in cellulose biosynthesis
MRRALPRMVARGLGTVYEFRRGEEAIISSFCNYGRDSVGGHLYGATQEALRRYQVSSLLVWAELGIARDRGSARLDLLRGDEPYKLRWNPKMVPNQRVILGREGLPFGLYARYRRLRSAARGYVGSEETPPWFRTILDRLRGARSGATSARSSENNPSTQSDE